MLTPVQSGFIPGNSTIKQLVTIYNDLCQAFAKALQPKQFILMSPRPLTVSGIHVF